MQRTRRRWLTVGVASMALVLAGTASVAARPGDRDDPFGFGGGGLRERIGLGGLARGMWDGLVRSETTYQTDEGSLVTQRIDNGTLSVAAEGSIEYTLATGESATAIVDEDTNVIAFTTESIDFGRGFHRERLVGEPIAVTDIAAGSQVAVWAESQEDGSYLADRIIVQPSADATDETATEDGSATEDTTEVEPAASPDAAASPTTDA